MAFMKSQLCVVLLLAVSCAIAVKNVSIEEWRRLLKDTVEYKEWCNSTANQARCSKDDKSEICSDNFSQLLRAMRKLHRIHPIIATNVAYDPEICNSSSTNATGLLDAEGNATPGVPKSNESNNLYWVLAIIIILLIAMVVGGIYIICYTKKAGYHHSYK